MNFFGPRVLKDPVLHPPLAERVGLRLRVELERVQPVVWRSIEIPSDIRLDEFHMILQGALGWQHCHLHSFSDGSGQYKSFVADYEIAVADEVDTLLPQQDYRVDQLLQQPGDRLAYAYDYGDGWMHEVVVEEVLDQPPAVPRVIAGEHACPPEDCGGPERATEFAAWARSGFSADTTLADDAEEREMLRAWLGEWSPDSFTLDSANEDLAFMLRHHMPLTPELGRIIAHLPPRHGDLISDAVLWPIWHQPVLVQALTPAQIQPFSTLFELISDGVKLTAAKYLPPAIVKEWTSRLSLDTHILNGAREVDSALVHVRELARNLGLVHVRNGVIKPTKKARDLGVDGEKWARHLGTKLPLGTADFERHAGFATLVVIGSGTPRSQWMNLVQQYLVDMGWQHRDGSPPSPYNDTYFALNLFITGPTGSNWDAQQIEEHEKILATVARSVVKDAR